MPSFVPHSDRHDYRQIPCPQVTTEIQKCCQLAASENGYRFVLVYRDLHRIDLYLLELSHRFQTDRCVFRAMDVHIAHVLHDDLSHTSKATSAGARKQWPLILEQRNVSLTFSNLQEDTIWHRLGAIGLAACYFPFLILVFIEMATNLRGEKANILWMSAITLIYFNSSINPFLYCWKMKQVRQAAKVTVLQVFFCSSS